MTKKTVVKSTYQSGQSLIEMVVALGLAIVIVGAIASLTVNGLRNASQSQNQTVATKLAQQVMDQVKSDGNQNCTVENGSPNQFWGTTFSGNKFAITTGAYCLTTTGTSSSFSSPDDNLYTYDIWINEVAAPNPLKEITVHVNWTDTTGTHYAELVSDVTLN